jgi:hypothetical protein
MNSVGWLVCHFKLSLSSLNIQNHKENKVETNPCECLHYFVVAPHDCSVSSSNHLPKAMASKATAK